MREADKQDAKITAIGATRDMCHACQETAKARALIDKVVTPLKK